MFIVCNFEAGLNTYSNLECNNCIECIISSLDVSLSLAAVNVYVVTLYSVSLDVSSQAIRTLDGQSVAY